VRRIQRNIHTIDTELKSLTEEIQLFQEKITNIKKKNLKLEDDKKYQTIDEIEGTNAQILENEKIIQNTQKEIKKLEERKQMLTASRKDAEERLEILKKEKDN
ncbi:MAG: hypothetical protein K2H01_05460, partial [Ruminococcus sp.]|nr:hypothetical protein [Ruminococcus sp.]